MTLSSLKSVQRVQDTLGVHQIHGAQLSLKRQCGVMSSYRREILFHAQVLSNILYLPKHNWADICFYSPILVFYEHRFVTKCHPGIHWVEKVTYICPRMTDLLKDFLFSRQRTEVSLTKASLKFNFWPKLIARNNIDGRKKWKFGTFWMRMKMERCWVKEELREFKWYKGGAVLGRGLNLW